MINYFAHPGHDHAVEAAASESANHLPVIGLVLGGVALIVIALYVFSTMRGKQVEEKYRK